MSLPPFLPRLRAPFLQATPLQELYENSKGRIRRDSVALALELQEQAECTFAPNLRKTGPASASPAEAKLTLSGEVGAGGSVFVWWGGGSAGMWEACVRKGLAQQGISYSGRPSAPARPTCARQGQEAPHRMRPISRCL